MITVEQFQANQVVLGEDIATAPGAAQHVTSFSLNPQGSATYFTSTGAAESFIAAEEVAGASPNFTVYRTAAGDEELDLYKPGTANSELQLTYAGFGEWRRDNPSAPGQPDREFFTYGILTPYATMANRFGTAQYTGVVHGAGEVLGASTRYDLQGSVNYTMDFTSETYTGSLAIKGFDTVTSAERDFDPISIPAVSILAANQSPNSPAAGAVNAFQNGAVVGQITNRFFGLAGDEIAGVFNFTVPGGPGPTNLVGVAAAKRN